MCVFSFLSSGLMTPWNRAVGFFWSLRPRREEAAAVEGPGRDSIFYCVGVCPSFLPVACWERGPLDDSAVSQLVLDNLPFSTRRSLVLEAIFVDRATTTTLRSW